MDNIFDGLSRCDLLLSSMLLLLLLILQGIMQHGDASKVHAKSGANEICPRREPFMQKGVCVREKEKQLVIFFGLIHFFSSGTS